METNAVFSRDSIRAVAAGPAGTNQGIDTSACTESRDTYWRQQIHMTRNLVVKAFMNDPLVKHKCRDEREIWKTGR